MITKAKEHIDGAAKKYGRMVGLDLSYFLEHGSWITVRYLFVGMFGLLLTAAFTRLSSKELLGQYQYVISVLALLSFFSFPGLNMVALREVARDNDGAVGQAVRESFVWSWFALPFIIGYGMYVAMSGRTGLGTALILAGALFPFYYAPNTWYVFYEGKSRFKPVTLRVIFSTIAVDLAVIAELFAKVGLPWLVATFFGLNAVFNWTYYREVLGGMRAAVKTLDRRYGVFCTIQKFTYSLTDALPQIVIASVLGFESVATYQVAYLSMTLVSGFVSALSATYIPLLFKYDKLSYARIAWLNMAVGLALFLGYAVFLRLFFILFFGESYRASYVLSWIFSFLMILLPLRVFLINFFTSRDENRLVIVANIVANIVGPGLFYLSRGFGFNVAVAIYFYSANLIFLATLLVPYVLRANAKTARSPVVEP